MRSIGRIARNTIALSLERFTIIYYPLYTGKYQRSVQLQSNLPLFIGYILPRSYSVRVAALAIGADSKWVDNVLSHFVLAGVEQGTRGVERQLNDDALLALALCRMLCKQLGIPTATAVEIANEIVADRSRTSATYTASPTLTLQFSISDIERSIRERLADATEATAHVRRGRPSRRTPRHD